MLVLKEENIENSTVYLSYKVLKKMKSLKETEFPIYEFHKICSSCGIVGYEQVINMLCFLFSLDLIYIKEPNICLK